ncbi:pyridoxal-phosphate dependent enzyme [Flexithrix dorotheae]|uniref:pyridoxal-phosphate dependent enzyme n=1 Tax=Flexithrix dorotheae TaxID=70993 RepID=UPI00037D068E|nr:pyridoxal-phosphate dependent enzyme [Flexithrix dorotheae]
MENNFPSREDINNAHQQISPFIHCTPVLKSSAINEMLGLEVFFKCENFQKIGAFKIRGATNAVLKLSEEEKKYGIATHSSGNHAQAIAYSAKVNHIPAYIVMPKTAPKVKVNAVKGYGAKVVMCEPNLQAREEGLKKVVEDTGARFIHPYNDYEIISGQATAAKELIEQTDVLHIIMAPVGGGGLLAGTALSAHYFSPQTKVIAGEPKGADDAYQSFKAGSLIPSDKPNTIADGLLTSVGEKNFPIIQKFVEDIITVSDEEIVAAMRIIWERMKIIIEPSSAVPFASLIKIKENFQGQKAGIILSGGNVDLGKLPF